MTRNSVFFCLVFLAGLLFTGLAMAQTRYSCRSASGGTIVSDKPCGSSSGMTYYGPTASQGTSNTYVPKVSAAPDHLKYLSPHCSSMNDAIRTGPARGVKYETTSELQKNYQRECADDERDAYSQLSGERNETRSAKNETKQAAIAAVQRTQIAQQQCDESKRILFIKKRRTDLTDGEKLDLLRFEENFKSRCS